MSRYNEFSDEVVNALSSGALKIAETLEIEDPTGTWWRLIQAKDETTARVFLQRKFPDPIFVGSQMLMGSKTAETAGAGQIYNKTIQPVMNMAWYSESMVPYSFVVYDNWGAGVVYDTDGNIVNTIGPNDYAEAATLRGAFWDHANQRIIASYEYTKQIRTLSAGLFDEAFIWAGYSQYVYYGEGYRCPKVFPEDPYKIYVLFTQSDGPKVKVVESTGGVSAHSLSYNTARSSGATAISVAANYKIGQADLLYSRKHQSVMLVWIDNAGDLYYALESEGWATAHLMIAGAAGAGMTLSGAGNLVLTDAGDNNGEYYIIGWRKQNDGTLGKPGGFSYPPNIKWIGSTPGDNDSFRLLGSVGSDWYIYQVDYNTMTITKGSSGHYVGFDPIYDPGSYGVYYQPAKLGENGDRELFLVQVGGGVRTKVETRGAVLICYDKAQGEIVWSWGGQGEWTNNEVWPHTYAGVGTSWYNNKCHHVLRINDRVMLIQKRNAASYNAQWEHYAIPITSLLACDTVQDVNDALIASGLHYVYPVDDVMEDPYTAYPWVNPLWGNMYITWGEVADRYVFVLPYTYYYNKYNYQRARYFFIDKNTWDLVAISDDALLPNTYKHGWGGGIYDPDTRTYRINFGNIDPDLDPWLRAYFASAKVRAYTDTWSVAKSATLYGDQHARIVALNEYGQSLFVSFNGTTVYISGVNLGASPDYTLAQRRLMLPFTPDIRATLVNEFENKIIFIGPVTDGEVSYTAITASEGDHEPYWAINAEDFADIYTLSFDKPFYGGVHAFMGYGSWAVFQDIVCNLQIIDTGAPLDAYLGGTGGEQGDAQSIIYEYTTLDYIPYPWEREGIKLEVSKLSKTCKVALPDTPDGVVKDMLNIGDFRGCRCIIRRLFLDADLENGAPDLVLVDGFIQDWGYSTEKGAVAFTVSRPLIDVTSTFPRRLLHMQCSHVFKGKRCQYTGEDQFCSKTWEDCVAKGNEMNFGGFPWVAARQRKVMWR